MLKFLVSYREMYIYTAIIYCIYSVIDPVIFLSDGVGSLYIIYSIFCRDAPLLPPRPQRFRNNVPRNMRPLVESDDDKAATLESQRCDLICYIC